MDTITKQTHRLRFILSFVVIIFTLVWFLSLFWKVIPAENKDVINFASGVILGQGWVTIIKWWFPSDINSERKTELLARAEPIKPAENDQ
jgi:hypothetical protein